MIGFGGGRGWVFVLDFDDVRFGARSAPFASFLAFSLDDFPLETLILIPSVHIYSLPALFRYKFMNVHQRALATPESRLSLCRTGLVVSSTHCHTGIEVPCPAIVT